MLISPRHWDGWSTMEGRHLVLAYVAVAAIQLGYAGWIGLQWLRLRNKPSNATE